MGATYPFALLAHSWIRWAVLGLLVAVVLRAWRGRTGFGSWTPLDERLHAALVGVTDLQLVLGLWLYVGASPFARAFLADMASAIHERALRFFGLEHATIMIAAVALVHVGRARSKTAADPLQRHRRVFAWTLAALICVVSSIPWPFFPIARPLFRFE